MKITGSLSHPKCECKHHVAFISKYRRKILSYELREHLGDIFRVLALQREVGLKVGKLNLFREGDPPLRGTSLTRFERLSYSKTSGFAGGYLY